MAGSQVVECYGSIAYRHYGTSRTKSRNRLEYMFCLNFNLAFDCLDICMCVDRSGCVEYRSVTLYYDHGEISIGYYPYYHCTPCCCQYAVR